MKLKKISLNAPTYLTLGFLGIILIGAILLCLPISHNEGVSVNLFESLFTSVSAVCVTGLVVVDTADTFNIFGRLVIMLLIQMGGLGFSTIAILILISLGRKINFKGKMYLMEGLNLNSMKDILRMVKKILLYTLVVEFIGFVLATLIFSSEYSLLESLGYGLFHSVSAFNNAGFDLFGGFNSLTSYDTHILLNLLTMSLIIIGGLGFYVASDIVQKRSFKKLTVHSKICISVSTFLILFGTLIIFIANSGESTVLESLFQSVSTRTAGFATQNLANYSEAALFIMCILMFVGANPSSTGGGIKTTTMFISIASIFNYLRNKPTTVFKRTIPQEVVAKTYSLITIASSSIGLFTLIASLIENLPILDIFFEMVSAFATVGLSTGITPDLNPFTQVLLMILMFVGRLGPITIGFIFTSSEKLRFKYAEEKVLIG